jgi:uncharacterized protein (TIGR03067 family)
MKSLLYTCALVLAVTTAASARAADAVAPVQAASGGYSIEQLQAALTKLGYEFERVDASANRCSIITDHDGLKLYLNFTINVEHQSLWLWVSLANLPPADQISPDVVLNLLRENARIRPAFFEYVPNTKQICLQRRYENSDWSPARLRREITAFDELARSLRPLWKPETLLRHTPASPEVSKAELVRLQGTYRMVDGSVLNGNPVTAAQVADERNRVQIKGSQITMAGTSLDLTVDPSTQPARIDVTSPEGGCEIGIYKMEGDVLVIHLSRSGNPRSTDFNGKVDQVSIIRLQRIAN